MNARRYFLGNTELDGHGFDYRANPVTILKGRMVAVAVLVAWNVAAEISPPLFLALLPVVAAAYPVLINRGLRFDARMTAHRNVRFDFEGSYRRAFIVFVVLPAPLLQMSSLTNHQPCGRGEVPEGVAPRNAGGPLTPDDRDGPTGWWRRDIAARRA